MPDYIIRSTTPDDAAPLCALLNTIIARGGTTAIEVPLEEGDFQRCFIDGEGVLSSLAAEAVDGSGLLGFQILERIPELPAGWADIATFARVHHHARGVGTALFAHTRVRARALRLLAINARIRADNAGGLAYYSKMGFEDYRVDRAVPLRDGTRVDRIFKRYPMD